MSSPRLDSFRFQAFTNTGGEFLTVWRGEMELFRRRHAGGGKGFVLKQSVRESACMTVYTELAVMIRVGMKQICFVFMQTFVFFSLENALVMVYSS